MDTMLALAMALGALCGAATGPLQPRVSVSFAELAQEAVSSRAVPNASALLLVPRRSALYVGARDAILALDAHNVSREMHPALTWEAENPAECRQKRGGQTECFNFVRVLHEVNETHLYVCGTGAFMPKCAYINVADFSFVRTSRGAVLDEEGKGKCPFHPAHRHTSLMVGRELYTGTSNNYLGSESVVQRSPSSMRSELSSWLYNPVFVASEFVKESASRQEDDKVYFFFTETAVEFDFYSRVAVPRIARVCTGDMGGLKMLEKKWTSFLKSRLDCSLGETTFTGLRHAVATRLGDGGDTVFHALFTDQTPGGAVSAVCSYSMAEVQRVFTGHFKHQGASDQRWVSYPGTLPQRRPGQCPLGWNSQALPPDTLAFVSDHPLMDGAVEADTGRPWLLVPGVSYSRLLVAHVAGLDGTSWRTALLGTDGGALHRAVLLGPGAPHLVEELQVLGHQEPVLSMVLSHDQTAVVVAGAAGVVRLPVCRCGRYRACWDCVRARDPCCAWDPRLKACRWHAGEKDTRSWLQDVSGGNATALCSAHPPDVPAARVLLAPALLLACSPPSRAATLSWSGPAPGQPLPPPGGGLLLLQGAPGAPQDLVGTYLCWAEEGGHQRLVANYTVHVPDSSSKSSSATTKSAGSTGSTAKRKSRILDPMTSAAGTTADSQNHLPIKEPSEFGQGMGAGMGLMMLLLLMLAAVAFAAKTWMWPKFLRKRNSSGATGAVAERATASNGRAAAEAEEGGPGNANGNNNAELAGGAGTGKTAGEDGDRLEVEKPLLMRLASLQRSSEA